MTKRLLIILGSILLAMIVILLLPVQAPDPGIPSTGTVPSSSSSATTAPTTVPTSVTTIPTQPTTVPTVPPTTLPPPPGQVRLYTCDDTLLES